MCQSSPHKWRYLEPKVIIHEVIKCLQSLSASQRLLLEQVCRVGHLLLVMPAKNATSECSFSVLRRLKSYLWSTMSQPRLNHVMVLSIYKELLKICTPQLTSLQVVANIGSVCLVPSLCDKQLEIDLLNTKSLQQSIRIAYLKTCSRVHVNKSRRVSNNEQKWVGN